jgi:hypothetical protein
VGGEPEDGVGGKGPREIAGSENGGVECLGSLVIRHNDDRRGVRGTHEVRKVECTGSYSKSGHTTATRTSAEVAAYALESFRVFKVRKNLTDKRKNHSSVILVELVPALLQQE